jgi:hypothetical protein
VNADVRVWVSMRDGKRGVDVSVDVNVNVGVGVRVCVGVVWVWVWALVFPKCV